MIGIIGGTGLGESLGALGAGQSHTIDTPFGMPSGPVITTQIAGTPVALLSRHGEGHLLGPSSVPFRANIYALKSLGVTHILASAAVGSLRETIAPRDLVLPDQVIDKTFCRPNSFFDGMAAHVEMATPFCPTLRRVLSGRGRWFAGQAALARNLRVHGRPAVLDARRKRNAPRVGRRPHRHDPHARGQAGARGRDLLRGGGAGHRLRLLAQAHRTTRTSCDLLEEIIGNVKAATQNALVAHRQGASRTSRLEAAQPCDCQSALKLGIWSDRRMIPADVRQRLSLIIGKYLG